ncbi:DNA-binding transcriptional regulator TyrR [Enterovibrio norvegicus]|uniref:HTH-type transcriptional regulatory protein TyrR n=2 Tax=Enterovibrio norvegicus TaxID=188144 RepID=A0A2N7L9W4_9GAMM|nr:transcriptional regulator TyrR [Enterovibrio norvegicus]MCC4796557.1 transcriptional regulator TyrR [Enterovibrio norvegicus]OEF52405.1 DNA-binding transcriptional regulator TyrR [Enterovibrio norvegicus]OEF55379.1 DNA-binding transcriptional regulator TyrR [Enterovibrio norvegicus]PMI35926.1 DNA-binding transcriptional regulator TyrR [Enterovibrio norvegicus]PMN52998.1 DNA-binding transcriptional regulator TyrR [Enterovibrio norvegicus]
MRLQVYCEDRLGLTRELLDILARRNIDLRGIEIDQVGIIYLNCPEIEFDEFRQLMSEIRLISGVTDVRKIQFLPAEREHRELRALLETLSDPVFSLNLTGKVDMANKSAFRLMGSHHENLIGESANVLFPDFNFAHWLEREKASQVCRQVVLTGIDYLMEVMPVYVTDSEDNDVLASAVVQLKQVSMNHLPTTLYRTPGEHGFEHLVGQSSKFRALVNQAKKFALLDAPLLIQGETGTGKELLAKACHQRSHRAEHPFLLVNCVSMPDDAAETELFGCAPGPEREGKKGQFEQADGGTVFLYEVGEMSPHLQIKLLRFMQDGTFRRVGEEHEVKVDVRVICSTQKNLSELVTAGQFREDLYYRLNVLSLTVPPLRERPSDVQPLAELFLNQFSAELGQERPALQSGVPDFLSQYSWPGNIRQLRNVLFRAVTQIEDGTLTKEDIQLPETEQSAFLTEESMDGSLDDIMKRYESGILSNLYRSYPSTRKLAKRLSVSHTAIANKLREYSIGKK